MNASLTLVTILVLQTVMLGVWILFRNRDQFAKIFVHWRLSSLVGLTSTLGSIGWFTAFALTQVAYVKTVGQIELIFSLFVTHKIFKERLNKSEGIAIFLMISSILLLIYSQ